MPCRNMAINKALYRLPDNEEHSCYSTNKNVLDGYMRKKTNELIFENDKAKDFLCVGFTLTGIDSMEHGAAN